MLLSIAKKFWHGVHAFYVTLGVATTCLLVKSLPKLIEIGKPLYEALKSYIGMLLSNA